MRSKRENYLIIGTGTLVGALVLWFYVITPYSDARASMQSQRDVAEKQLVSNRRLFRDESESKTLWAQMSAIGVADQPSQAERKMLHALRAWAQESGVGNLSLRPERTNRDFGYVKIIVHAGGSGPEAAIAKLLWSIESAASIAMRVDDVTLTPIKEGTDDLTMTLTVSALCVATEADKQAVPPTKSARPSSVTPSGPGNLVEDRP